MADDLVPLLQTFTDKRGGHTSLYETGLAWVNVLRSSIKPPAQHVLYRPSLCVVAQGQKHMLVGDDRLTYEAMQALVVRVEMPGRGQITDASPEKPFLGMTIDFDVPLLRDLALELESKVAPDDMRGHGLFVIDIEGALADAITQLARILDNPAALRILGPALKREIAFWLLKGKHGSRIASIAIADSRIQNIAAAIKLLHSDITKPVRIEHLAKVACMSNTSFHEHFKSITSLTPLQFQKRLRLLEARRLLMDESANAETAAFKVGYQSPSQFSREYSRMFGTPPRRDTQRKPRTD